MARGKRRARDRAKRKSKETANETRAAGSVKERVAEASRALDRVTLVLTLVGVCAFAIFTGYLVGQYAIRFVASPLITNERAENPGTRLVDDEVEAARSTSASSQASSATPRSSQSPQTQQPSTSTAAPASTRSTSSQPAAPATSTAARATTPSSTAAPAPSSTTRSQAQPAAESGRATIYRVQVGRFASRAEATRQADALKAGQPAVPDAWVLFDDAAGVYRVQAGAFSNEQRAREFVEQLAAKGYDAYIAP